MQVDLIAITHFLSGNGTPEELIEHAGRVCYRSQSRGNPAAFLRARLRDGHESIIEHASATFEVSGISRACSHQLVRHRLASYSQESQRYVDMSNPELVIGICDMGRIDGSNTICLPGFKGGGCAQRGCTFCAAQCCRNPHCGYDEFS